MDRPINADRLLSPTGSFADRPMLRMVRAGNIDGESTIWTLRKPSINRPKYSRNAGSTNYKVSDKNSVHPLSTTYPLSTTITSYSLPTIKVMCLSVPFQVISHDVWRRQGLGKTALRIWTELHTREEWTTIELVDKLGWSPRVIKRLLKLLGKHRFV